MSVPLEVDHHQIKDAKSNLRDSVAGEFRSLFNNLFPFFLELDIILLLCVYISEGGRGDCTKRLYS